MASASSRGQRRIRNAFAVQGGLCWYCGVLCHIETYKLPKLTRATIEHLIRGNELRAGSTVMACYDCNNTKSHWSNVMTRNGIRMLRPGQSQPAAVAEWEARPENAGRKWGNCGIPGCNDGHNHQPPPRVI